MRARTKLRTTRYGLLNRELDRFHGLSHHLQVSCAVVALADAFARLAKQAIDDVAGDLVGFEPGSEASACCMKVDQVGAYVFGRAAGFREILSQELGAAWAVIVATLVGKYRID